MGEKTYYSIGQVSNICKIPIKTLRYYDEIKLLVPDVRKETSKYRYYSKEQLVVAFRIRQLRMLGFNLKDIKQICQNQVEAYIQSVQRRLHEIDEEMLQLEKRRKENEQLLLRLQEGKEYLNPASELEIYKLETIPQIQLYSYRSVIEAYRNEEITLDKWINVYENALEDGLEITGPIYVTFFTEMFGQFFAKDCDIEFAVQVAEPVQENEKIHAFGGMTAATAIYKGNYENIFKTYISLKRWIDENHYEICGNITEQFLISPIDTGNCDEHVTKIIVPVKDTKKKGKHS